MRRGRERRGGQKGKGYERLTILFLLEAWCSATNTFNMDHIEHLMYDIHISGFLFSKKNRL